MSGQARGHEFGQLALRETYRCGNNRVRIGEGVAAHRCLRHESDGGGDVCIAEELRIELAVLALGEVGLDGLAHLVHGLLEVLRLQVGQRVAAHGRVALDFLKRGHARLRAEIRRQTDDVDGVRAGDRAVMRGRLVRIEFGHRDEEILGVGQHRGGLHHEARHDLLAGKGEWTRRLDFQLFRACELAKPVDAVGGRAIGRADARIERVDGGLDGLLQPKFTFDLRLHRLERIRAVAVARLVKARVQIVVGDLDLLEALRVVRRHLNVTDDLQLRQGERVRVGLVVRLERRVVQLDGVRVLVLEPRDAHRELVGCVAHGA